MFAQKSSAGETTQTKNKTKRKKKQKRKTKKENDVGKRVINQQNYIRCLWRVQLLNTQLSCNWGLWNRTKKDNQGDVLVYRLYPTIYPLFIAWLDRAFVAFVIDSKLKKKGDGPSYGQRCYIYSMCSHKDTWSSFITRYLE